MNPFLQQLLGGFARVAIVWVAAQAGHDITDDQAAHIFLTYVVPIAVFLWSAWQHYRSRQKMTTALASGQAMSEKQVETVIANGGAASVLTPKTSVPQ